LGYRNFFNNIDAGGQKNKRTVPVLRTEQSKQNKIKGLTLEVMFRESSTNPCSLPEHRTYK